MTPNLVETNTHVSTQHSMIRKQLSKIGQSTEWHFNTQTCTRSNPTQIFRPKVCQAHKLATLGISSCHIETQLTRIITLITQVYQWYGHFDTKNLKCFPHITWYKNSLVTTNEAVISPYVSYKCHKLVIINISAGEFHLIWDMFRGIILCANDRNSNPLIVIESDFRRKLHTGFTRLTVIFKRL